ncbi:MAG: hypothetical protein AAF799_15910 [Myxococcota bacterium]
MSLAALGCGTAPPGALEDGSGSAGSEGSGSEGSGTDTADDPSTPPPGPGSDLEPGACYEHDILRGAPLDMKMVDQPIVDAVVIDPTGDGDSLFVTYDGADCLSRLDGDGLAEWTYDDSGCDSLDVDPQGNALLAGTISVTPDNSEDFVRVHKVSPQGEQLWVVDLQEPGVQYRDFVVASDGTGDLLVAGNEISERDFGTWLYRISGDGDVQWRRRIADATQYTYLSVSSPDAIHVAYNAFNSGHFVYARRFDAEGEPQWTTQLPNPGGERLRVTGFAADSQGNVGIASSTRMANGAHISNHLHMVNADGSVRWDLSSVDFEWLGRARSMAFDHCDDLVVAGLGSPGDQHLGQAWVAKFAPDGETVWSEFYNSDFLNDAPIFDNDLATAVDIYDDGSILAFGLMTVDLEQNGTIVDVLRRWHAHFEP